LGIELARHGVLRRIVQEAIDGGQHLLWGLPQLPGRFATRDVQRLRGPTLEPEVDTDLVVLEQGDVFQEEAHQPFAVPGGGLGVLPHPWKVGSQCPDAGLLLGIQEVAVRLSLPFIAARRASPCGASRTSASTKTSSGCAV
jgi:hypothetical protein